MESIQMKRTFIGKWYTWMYWNDKHEREKQGNYITENDKPTLRKWGKVIRGNHENDL